MTDWTQVIDAHGLTGRVPVLLAEVERAESPEAWAELWDRLCLHGETLSPASFAALPQLATLATLARWSDQALELADAITRGVLQHHDGEALLADCGDAVDALRKLADQRLQTRPSDYHRVFCDLLALRGQYHWSAVLDDFTDDFYAVSCPHRAVEVIIAIGDYGRYSAIRDWDLGDVDRRALQPAPAQELHDPGRWMHATAVRDEQLRLAEGIRHLFGKAECPRCASMFGVAEAYTTANLPHPSED